MTWITRRLLKYSCRLSFRPLLKRIQNCALQDAPHSSASLMFCFSSLWSNTVNLSTFIFSIVEDLDSWAPKRYCRIKQNHISDSKTKVNNYFCCLTLCTSPGEGPLSSSSEGIDFSFIFPLARSIKNSAGFIAISGKHPMDEKYTIASEVFPKYNEFPLLKRISLSNLLNRRLEGWCIVVTTVFPAYAMETRTLLE